MKSIKFYVLFTLVVLSGCSTPTTYSSAHNRSPIHDSANRLPGGDPNGDSLGVIRNIYDNTKSPKLVAAGIQACPKLESQLIKYTAARVAKIWWIPGSDAIDGFEIFAFIPLDIDIKVFVGDTVKFHHTDQCVGVNTITVIYK